VKRRPEPSGSVAFPEGSSTRSSPTPPWLWLLLIGSLALVFWQFVPKTEIQVNYYPWFIEQVESDNIKSLSIQGTESRGELRTEQQYLNPSTLTTTVIRKFSTNAPSEDSIQPIVQKLIQNDRKIEAERKKTVEPTRIDSQPTYSANGLAWIMLLLPTCVILGFICLMMRRARDQSDGRAQGPFVKGPAEPREEDKVARAEKAIVEALKLCRETAESPALPQEQRERLERAMSEFEKLLKSLQQSE